MCLKREQVTSSRRDWSRAIDSITCYIRRPSAPAYRDFRELDVFRYDFQDFPFQAPFESEKFGAALGGTLSSFQDSQQCRPNTSPGQEVQLKLVQCLQKLDENYSDVLRGDLLAKILNLCITIESSGDGGARRAATAAFQQHIGSLFEAVKSATRSKRDEKSAIPALEDSGKVLFIFHV